MSHVTILFFIASIIIILFVIVVAFCSLSFQRNVGDEISDLSQRAKETKTESLSGERIDFLPEPVQRYVRYSLPEGAEPVRFARMKQTGEFRTDPAGVWMPVEAEQYFSAGFPAFIWHAKIQFWSLFWIDVRDKYDGGEGNMLVKIFSTIPVADAKGPEIDVSSLHRYIGEMPWFPTAFLNEEHITWEPIDSSHAKAVITDGENVASVEFSFDEEGRITKVTTEERFRTVGNQFSADKWTGYYYDYQEKNGLNVPMEIMGEWNLPDGNFSYVKLRVTEMEYDVFSGY
ncbi:hypothetical protein L0665_03530 [Methanogenium marinum]|uniref:Uncharacterized protein n=1 Tax=Methanogenium marinum TaxID=348610 RepID=A0A9Q4KNI5_9EURY|nr:DUF6544 family protein [Methanogenium marinum]MDE4907683.1 hypothetical protein [Methanogenium marinum]